MDIIDVIIEGSRFWGYKKGQSFEETVQALDAKGIIYDLGLKSKIIRYGDMQLYFDRSILFMIQYTPEYLSINELISTLTSLSIAFDTDDKYTFHDQISLLVTTPYPMQIIVDKNTGIVEKVSWN